MDPWMVTSQEWTRFCEHFQSLKPVGGLITGEQAKGFLLQSRLPPPVLGAIWALADTDADGRMNIIEFTIACKLISLKLRGLELPKVIPSNLWNSVQSLNSVPKVSSPLLTSPPTKTPGIVPPMTLPLSTVSPTTALPTVSPPIIPATHSPVSLVNSKISPVLNHSSPVQITNLANTTVSLGQAGLPHKPIPPAAPSLTGTPVTSMPMPISIDSPGNQEWAVPQQTKLKYTQLFNTTDRMRTGFLTGVQARGIMVATQLPQNVLAQIWNLSDMDKDGQLCCDEFVLAMYLCDLAKSGEKIRIPLPPELIPPSVRRQRQNSLTAPSEGTPESDSCLINQTTFEDKRKENFEKGQAELERRRKALLEIQRKEQEERERKEREEQERKEKIRLEQEKRRQEELEIQMRKQKELEEEREEQRKRVQEQREAARKEMERQRQLEWEKQRSMELQQQRHKEQETVLKLKGKNQSLSIDLQQMTDKVRELSQKISETRASVTGVKSTIDSMRTTRDTQMTEMSRLKSTLKEQNQRLIAVSQEKIRLEAKNKINLSAEAAEVQEQTQLSVSNKKFTLKSLQDKINDLHSQIELKKQDVENNNSTIDQLKTQLTNLVGDCEKIYPNYEENTKKVIEMKKNKAKEMSSWGDDAWNSAPSTEWVEETSTTTLDPSAYKKCRALYEFEARNADELSFQPGDIIMVPLEQNAEPGWLAGDLKNKTGWFPESYVETVDGTDDIRDIIANRQAPLEDNFASTQKPLEGIAELPENEFGQGFETDELSSSSPTKHILGLGKVVNITARASSDWYDNNSTHLLLKSGDIVEVSEIQDDWWYGKTTDNRFGWFPKSCVTIIDNVIKDTNVPNDKQEYYIVLYPYESVEPGDLNMNQDEVVLVTKKDGDWWTGVIGDRSGIFPSNYVQYLDPQPNESTVGKNSPLETASSVMSETSVTSSPLTTPILLEPQKPNGNRSVTPDLASTKRESSATEDSENDDKIPKGTKKAEVATVIAPYTATSTEQLSLQRGQLVKIRKKTTTGWWEGELQAKGQKRQIGWFPASYVKPLGNAARANSPAIKSNQPVIPVAASNSSDSTIEKVIALFPFNAVHNDELTFKKDEIITLVSKDEQAWWRGELNGKTGLFPSNYVAPLSEVTIKVKLNKEERKRQQHIHELITTEQAYIEDMTAVHEVFEKPLYESGVLTTSDICKIFINWKEIIECNQMFLTSLRVRRDMSPAGIVRIVGDILCEHFPRMTRYVRFCSCQLNAAITLQKLTETNPAFCEVTKRCQSDLRIKGLPLSSFLIKPMQRITKYPLLVQKILEHTPTSHPDHLHLEEALAKSEEICLQVNEGVREKENSDRLEWLQTHVNSEGLSERLIFNSLTNSLGSRKFLHYGSLSKTKSGKELVGFLMNDMFLLVKPLKPSILAGQSFTFDKFSGDSFKIYKQPFLLMLLNTGEPLNDSVEFRIDYDNLPILLSAPSINERNLWLKKINEAKQILIVSEKNQKQLLESKKADFGACGRVLVIVMDGRKLQAPKLGKKATFCEVSMGSRKQCTPVNESPDPKWDSSMQFLVKDIQDDILCVTVFNKGHYSPDEFLGRSEIRVSEIIQSTKNSRGPLTKHLQLREVHTGIITLKLDLCLFDKN